jgi:cytochrome c-type biogenesis protein CcmH/NrfF
MCGERGMREGTQHGRQNVVNTILGVGVSNWVLWAVMVLFIAIYFVVTEIMNRREDEARNRGEGE